MNYKLKKIKDKYIIYNEGTTNLTYKLSKFITNDFFEFYDGEILPGENVILDLIEDNHYKVSISDSIKEITLNIYYYLNLLNSIIKDINIICIGSDCCKSCSENDEEKEMCNLLTLSSKISLYKRLTANVPNNYYNKIYEYFKFLIHESVYCDLNKELITGKKDCNVKLMKEIISLDFLSIYFYEFNTICLTEEKEYINNKFNIEKLFCCIQSLGIDIEKLEDLINKINMGNFKITSVAYVNQPPSQIGDYEMSVANRAVTTLTMDMFTSLTTPAYADPENDPADAIRLDSLPVDGEIKLNGINVTIGQIINKTDIDAGNLKYHSPNQDTTDIDTFDFSVRDSGSGLFSS